MKRRNKQNLIHPLRLYTVLGSFALAAGLLGVRAFDLQVFNNDFLQGQGDARFLRTTKLAAHRGMITDRHGEPLAISTPVDSVWANPSELLAEQDRLGELAGVIGMKTRVLRQRIEQRMGREFVYLKRHIDPDLARRVMDLKLPGVSLQREYRRYYPDGEVVGHVLGFTNVDDAGQEGIELAYDQWLSGVPGSKRVIKDRYGRIVEDVERISRPMPGRDLPLSIDRGVQYLAYRELKAAVRQHKARSGSLVMLDVRTGEILAMVNQPSFNPNNRRTLRSGNYRNRAVTDVFEPGSTVKPFTVAAALESGQYTRDSRIDTSPGRFRVGGSAIRDHRNYGEINLRTLLQKSSNIGASKIALSIAPERLWNVFSQVGFGLPTASGFPGEVAGQLSDQAVWRDIERATLSYGYGLSVTTLQLARAYAVLANEGRMAPVTLRLASGEPEQGRIALSRRSARQVVSMLESVVKEGGTGMQASVPGYRVAGKTGTVLKFDEGRYSDEHYVALFAGMAPASDPRLVTVVMIDEPNDDFYYGGDVAAPVFGKVMAGAMRMIGIPPDDAGLKNLRHASVHSLSIKDTGLLAGGVW